MKKRKVGTFKIKLWVVPELTVLHSSLNGVAPPTDRNPRSIHFSNELSPGMSTDSHPSTNHPDAYWHLKNTRVNQMSGSGDVNARQIQYVAVAGPVDGTEPPTAFWNSFSINITTGGSSKDNANPLGHVIASNKQTQFATLVAPIPSVLGSGDPFVRTIPIEDLDIPPDLVTASRSVVMPDLAPLATQRLYKRLSDSRGAPLYSFEPEEIKPERSGNHIVGEGTAKLTYDVYVAEVIDLHIIYNPATLKIELSMFYAEAEDLSFVTDYNSQLADRAAKFEAGFATPALLTRPPEIDQIEDHDLQAELENWWKTYDEAQKSMYRAADDESIITDKLAELQLSIPEATRDTLLTNATEKGQEAATAGSGSSIWRSLWDGVKTVGAGTVDLLKSWGPVGTVGAYAGYSGVKAVNSMPKWVWLAVGAGALILIAS